MSLCVEYLFYTTYFRKLSHSTVLISVFLEWLQLVKYESQSDVILNTSLINEWNMKTCLNIFWGVGWSLVKWFPKNTFQTKDIKSLSHFLGVDEWSILYYAVLCVPDMIQYQWKMQFQDLWWKSHVSLC